MLPRQVAVEVMLLIHRLPVPFVISHRVLNIGFSCLLLPIMDIPTVFLHYLKFLIRNVSVAEFQCLKSISIRF